MNRRGDNYTFRIYNNILFLCINKKISKKLIDYIYDNLIDKYAIKLFYILIHNNHYLEFLGFKKLHYFIPNYELYYLHTSNNLDI